MWNKLSQNGQSLIEMVIVIAVGVLVASALVFATIASLRNSQFAKNQSIATKLAQEGLEAVRSIRDRNIEDECNYGFFDGDLWITTNKFSDLYSRELGDQGYFSLTNTKLDYSTERNSWRVPEGASDIFQRQVQILDTPTTFRQEKVVIVRVKWSDFSGEHQSKLSTILTKK